MRLRAREVGGGVHDVGRSSSNPRVKTALPVVDQALIRGSKPHYQVPSRGCLCLRTCIRLHRALTANEDSPDLMPPPAARAPISGLGRSDLRRASVGTGSSCLQRHRPHGLPDRPDKACRRSHHSILEIPCPLYCRHLDLGPWRGRVCDRRPLWDDAGRGSQVIRDGVWEWFNGHGRSPASALPALLRHAARVHLHCERALTVAASALPALLRHAARVHLHCERALTVA